MSDADLIRQAVRDIQYERYNTICQWITVGFAVIGAFKVGEIVSDLINK